MQEDKMAELILFMLQTEPLRSWRRRERRGEGCQCTTPPPPAAPPPPGGGIGPPSPRSVPGVIAVTLVQRSFSCFHIVFNFRNNFKSWRPPSPSPTIQISTAARSLLGAPSSMRPGSRYRTKYILCNFCCCNWEMLNWNPLRQLNSMKQVKVPSFHLRGYLTLWWREFRPL